MKILLTSQQQNSNQEKTINRLTTKQMCMKRVYFHFCRIMIRITLWKRKPKKKKKLKTKFWHYKIPVIDVPPVDIFISLLFISIYSRNSCLWFMQIIQYIYWRDGDGESIYPPNYCNMRNHSIGHIFSKEVIGRVWNEHRSRMCIIHSCMIHIRGTDKIETVPSVSG